MIAKFLAWHPNLKRILKVQSEIPSERSSKKNFKRPRSVIILTVLIYINDQAKFNETGLTL